MSNNLEFSNFSFLKDISNDLYSTLLEAERNCRINGKNCAAKLRIAFESFVKSIFSEKSMNYPETLFEAVKVLEDNKILSSSGSHHVDINGGNPEVLNDNAFVRKYGNSGPHPDDSGYIPIRYAYSLNSLRTFRQMLADYYHVNVPPFSEMRMPIGDYFIESGTDINEIGTNCKYEFRGYRLNDSGQISCWSIIRAYEKIELDASFTIREQITFDTASKLAEDLPSGMPNIDVICSMDDIYGETYIISYNFNQKPIELESVLKDLTKEQQLDICLRLACYFSFFHSCEPVICHRMLDYSCIYLCKIRDRYIPKLTRFNFSKINGFITVRSKVNLRNKNNKKYIRSFKYAAPEGLTGMTDDIRRADIYSLGVLMGDILTRKINDRAITGKELLAKGTDERLCKLITDMTSKQAAARPTADEVCERLEEIL